MQASLYIHTITELFNKNTDNKKLGHYPVRCIDIWLVLNSNKSKINTPGETTWIIMNPVSELA